MLFSRLKISCFRAKAHLVSHWCLYNRTTFSSYLTSMFDIRYLEYMSHLSNVRQMRYTSFVIGNFFKKALVTKVSCPKLLVTLKMMDIRQNVNVILHVRQLSFRIRALHTQLKSKCRNFKNSIVNTKKSFLYYLYKLLLHSIYFKYKSN